MDKITIEEYINHFPGKKKKMYTTMYNNVQFDCRFKNHLETFLKSDEDLYTDITKVRGRAIHNPTPHVKVFGGTLNSNLIKATKLINPHFVSGLNIGELTTLI
jgi:hypothetical protein